MKKFTQWKRRSSRFFGMRPKTELTTYEGRGGEQSNLLCFREPIF